MAAPSWIFFENKTKHSYYCFKFYSCYLWHSWLLVDIFISHFHFLPQPAWIDSQWTRSEVWLIHNGSQLFSFATKNRLLEPACSRPTHRGWVSWGGDASGICFTVDRRDIFRMRRHVAGPCLERSPRAGFDGCRSYCNKAAGHVRVGGDVTVERAPSEGASWQVGLGTEQRNSSAVLSSCWDQEQRWGQPASGTQTPGGHFHKQRFSSNTEAKHSCDVCGASWVVLWRGWDLHGGSEDQLLCVLYLFL